MTLTPETKRILVELDVEKAQVIFKPWKRVFAGDEKDREIALAAIHKARILAGRDIEPALRDESKKWLLAHHYRVPHTPWWTR